jgi:hypothetical protein
LGRDEWGELRCVWVRENERGGRRGFVSVYLGE